MVTDLQYINSNLSLMTLHGPTAWLNSNAILQILNQIINGDKRDKIQAYNAFNIAERILLVKQCFATRPNGQTLLVKQNL